VYLDKRSKITMMLRLLTLSLAAWSATAFVPSTNTRSAFLAKTSDSTAPAVVESPAFSSMTTELCAGLTATELPEKLYLPEQKEVPKVLGGIQIGLRKLVVITGASSGLGLACAVSLAKTGKYFVVMACRDVEKAKKGTFHVLKGKFSEQTKCNE